MATTRAVCRASPSASSATSTATSEASRSTSRRRRGGRSSSALLQRADIVVENYGPGTMERLGCGFERLSAQNPRLVYVALKGFLAGPYEQRPALDEVVQFMAGLAHMTGPPGRPLRAGASVIDILGGVFGVVGALAALQERERTGQGQLVRSALFETTAFLVGQHMAGHAVTGEEPPPMPARRGAWAVYQTFETADGEQLFLGITSNNHFRAFCEAFGRGGPERRPAAGDERHSGSRRAPGSSPKFRRSSPSGQKRSSCISSSGRSIPFAPVAKPADLFDDPHLPASGGLLDVLHARRHPHPLAAAAGGAWRAAAGAAARGAAARRAHPRGLERSGPRRTEITVARRARGRR